MTNDISNKYFQWLCSLVRPSGGWPGGKTFHFFLSMLYKKEFYSLVPHDENRGTDGQQLRDTFVAEVGKPGWRLALDGPCTVLEMMIAMARRIDFEMFDLVGDDSTARWFWEMCGNARIDCPDREWFVKDQYVAVEDAVDDILARGYQRSGKGGFFPLKRAAMDQRKVELAYQWSAYLMEKYH